MNFKLVAIFVLLFLASRVLAQERADEYERTMKTAGFWISRHPSPDAVIMGPSTIDRFNARLCSGHQLTKDIFTLSQNLRGAVIGTAPRYGLVVHYAPQRFLPTKQGLYEGKDDHDFDQLQNSALDVGTAVAVVHTSADGLWYYALTAISDGWVEAKYIALGDARQVRKFAEGKDFAVVIRPKADIFMNKFMTDYYDYVRMGMRLPLADVDAGRVTVNVPVMDANGALAVKQAYMNAEDVNIGFLPFTARNIYKQALMMLNQPYGWGDMHGEQDCSRFLQMVFATVGITLPRDSKNQAQVSNSIVDFDGKSDDAAKITAIVRAPAANTLLVMKGHIMLYLGTVNGEPYVIHDTTVSAMNRVIISDLSLGQGTSKGSLLKRLTRTVTIE
jgi:hypothetical protein